MKSSTIAILASLAGFEAVVAQQIGISPVWVDAATCDPWAKSNGFPAAAGPAGLFTTALGIINDIADVNIYRLYNPSEQSPTKLPTNVLAWERYRLNSTYDALFGNNTRTQSHGGWQPGVWDVAERLWGVQAQWGGTVHSDPYIFVVCDDAPYLSKNSNNKPVYTDPYYHAKLVVDSDAFLPNEDTITACATNGQSSYATHNNVNWTQNVIFCTKNMRLPLGFTSNGPTTFASGMTLDEAGRSWLGAVYTQALASFGDGRGAATAHGFAASHAIRNTIDGLLNPDSNKFFAFALMLDGLFWGSGVGQTSQQEYTNLQKTAAGRRMIATFGLTNITVLARGITWASGWALPNVMEEERPYIEPIPTA